MASERFRQLERSATGTLGGFRTFILRGNVIDLAVGIVIGTAFTAVVNSLVTNVITPLIPAPGGNLSNWQYTVPYTGKPILLGTFVNAIITFLILAFVVYYFVVLPVNGLMARFKPKEVQVPPATRDCPYCLTSIPLMATRCPACTSQLQPPVQGTPG
ncbi:MAG: large conductance mechanosensitive channel protein MscL, partial [Chloroflexi bacterium]